MSISFASGIPKGSSAFQYNFDDTTTVSTQEGTTIYTNQSSRNQQIRELIFNGRVIPTSQAGKAAFVLIVSRLGVGDGIVSVTAGQAIYPQLRDVIYGQLMRFGTGTVEEPLVFALTPSQAKGIILGRGDALRVLRLSDNVSSVCGFTGLFDIEVATV